MRSPVYLDNHATTRVDPRVLAAMLPYFVDHYGNAGSTSHQFGAEAREAVERARAAIGEQIGASAREIVFTSGATESNNLALRGVAERVRRRGNHLVSVVTEHKAVLDPLARLSRKGYDVTLLPVAPADRRDAGRIDVQQFADALRNDTLLASVMLANNEIGVLQPLAEIARLCRAKGVLLHCDATQAVGKLPLNAHELDVDLLSFSAHKIYGPKGVGALYVRRSSPPIRLEPLADGGGQEMGLRSGTLNVPGIVGLAQALQLCTAEMPTETERLQSLRDHLFTGLCRELTGVTLNGPALDDVSLRLTGNLNCRFEFVDGEALMMNLRDVAVSSGSACTSTNPEPSHVLRALGLSTDDARSSLRFGLGRFNTLDDVDTAVSAIAETVRALRKLSSSA
ncbi:MAG: aminotransferase class V-fold PLP-dependent enzyme [Pirellulales bacterium]